jgi:hypothetical protein
MSSGQDVHRRVGTGIAVGAFSFGLRVLPALSQSKKYCVGITWAYGQHKPGLGLQCDKNDDREFLRRLEGMSSKKLVNSAPRVPVVVAL